MWLISSWTNQWPVTLKESYKNRCFLSKYVPLLCSKMDLTAPLTAQLQWIFFFCTFLLMSEPFCPFNGRPSSQNLQRHETLKCLNVPYWHATTHTMWLCAMYQFLTFLCISNDDRIMSMFFTHSIWCQTCHFFFFIFLPTLETVVFTTAQHICVFCMYVLLWIAVVEVNFIHCGGVLATW